MRVLVTRPEPAASHTAERLRRLGHHAFVLPLSRIVPVEAVIPEGRYDAIAITSANAISSARPALVRPLLTVPVLAVGGKSAAVARKVGFAAVTVAEGDAAALGELATRILRAGSTVLYLAGRVRRPELEAYLHAGGFRVSTVETYDTVDMSSGPETPVRLGASAIDAALVYSAKGAELLAALARRPDLAAQLSDTRFLCLSAAVAEALGDTGGRIAVAASPNEDALLALL